MITLDPIEIPRMGDEELAAEDERQRALSELERLASPESLQGIRVPPPPGMARQDPGGRVYPSGQMPPPDPRTAARGAEDVYGSDPFGGRAPRPIDPGTRGALERSAQPRPELLAALRQRQAQQPTAPGAAMALGNPAGPPQASPEAAPPAEDAGPRSKLGRLMAARQGNERDYTGVDVADAIARPFRAIARGLAYASGRQPGQMASWGDQARARDRQADADALRAQQAQDQLAGNAANRELAARRVAATEENARTLAGSREANAALQAQREDRQSAIAARALDLRAQGMEATEALTQARLEDIRDRMTARQEARDPESAASQRAQERFGRHVDYIGQVSGRDLDISAEGMSVDDVRAMEQGLGLPRHVREPRGRGGGSGPLGRPEWFTGSDAEWGALGATGRRSAILRHSQRSGSEEDGNPEVILGSGIRFGGSVDAPTIRSVRDGLAEARGQSAALGTIDRIARERGARALVDPRIEADLVAATQAMMAMVATMRNTGVINPGEAPTIEAAIPNPRDLRQQTLGEVQRRVNAFRTLLEQRVNARLGVLGVTDADQRRVTQWLRSGSLGGGQRTEQRPAAPAGGPQSDRVRVRHPDGRSGSIPRSRLDAARAAGFEVVDG